MHTIAELSPDRIGGALALYRESTAAAAHCRFAPDAAWFAADLFGSGTATGRLYAPPLRARTWVVTDGGALLGFATLSSFASSDDAADRRERQAITGLFFRDAAAGKALIETCEAHADAPEIDAFPSTHGQTLIQAYNAGWDGLSDRVPGVAAVLAQCGYVPYFRELQLSLRLDAILRPPLRNDVLAGIDLRSTPTLAGGRDEARIQALAGEAEAGVCYCHTLASISRDPAAARVGYIGWLHVEAAHRRRGLARMLLLTALDRLAAQGCDECWLTTTADNWPAQTLYFSLGFTVVDGATSYRKTVSHKH